MGALHILYFLVTLLSALYFKYTQPVADVASCPGCFQSVWPILTTAFCPVAEM